MLILCVLGLQDLNQYVLLETLDILGDLVRRYGGTPVCVCVCIHCMYTVLVRVHLALSLS